MTDYNYKELVKKHHLLSVKTKERISNTQNKILPHPDLARNMNVSKIQKTIILCSVIITLAILFNGGFYKFETVQAGLVHKYNIFTGTIELCVQGRGCNEFKREDE